MVFEKGVTFRIAEIKEYYCEESKNSYELGVKVSEEAVKSFKSNGVDYYKQEVHDFSKLNYEVINKENGLTVVRITGQAKFEFKNTNFKTEKSVSEGVVLKRNDKTKTYCYLFNDKSK